MDTSFFTEYPIPRDINPLVQHDQSIGSSQADVSGDSGSEWLMDLSLEDLQDYSLEDIGIGGGECGGGDSCDGGNYDNGDCGSDELDDEAILDRVASEMDLNIPDATSSSRVCDTHCPTNTQSECSKDTDMNTNSHYEDSLFDRAYDLYESKIT